MFPLAEFPELVQHYAPFFENVFTAQAFIEFERYISGLIVSENETVDGINRLCVNESRNQSSLNRLLNESPFLLEELNQVRLNVMDSVPGTRIKPRGVLGVDDTLLTHYGQHFGEIAYIRSCAWDLCRGVACTQMLCLVSCVSIEKAEHLVENTSYQRIVHVLVKAMPSPWQCNQLMLHLVSGQFFGHED
jgi:hypothetical protein